MAAVLLGESEEAVADLIDFSRTTESYRELMRGNADLVIAAEPNASVFEEMEAADFEIEMQPFANVALVFMVNEDNPVESLTASSCGASTPARSRTGARSRGGHGDSAIPAQRESGSQVLMEKLVMDGTEMITPRRDT